MDTSGVDFPEPLEWIERFERYDWPMEMAFEKAGIEFDFAWGGRRGVAYWVGDLKRGTLVVVRVLKDAGAPPDTRVMVGSASNHRLGDLA